MAERENTRTAEQEQDERAWIAALPRRHSFTQIMGWAVIFRACALTFLAQTWAKLSYSLQQIISAVIKIIYAKTWSYSLSNSKQHTHISQQTPASPADCCGPGSFPDQLQATAQYRKNTHCWGNCAIIVTDGFTYSPPAWYFHGISKHWSTKDSQPFHTQCPGTLPAVGYILIRATKTHPLWSSKHFISVPKQSSGCADAGIHLCKSCIWRKAQKHGVPVWVEMSLNWKLSQGPICSGKKPNSHFILSLGCLCWCYCKWRFDSYEKALQRCSNWW